MRISCARLAQQIKLRLTCQHGARRALICFSNEGNSTQSTSRIRHPPYACSPLRSEAAGRS